MALAEHSGYPKGLKKGDFVQSVDHFGDIFFEVVSCGEGGNHWSISHVTYEKYGSKPRNNWFNSATRVRRVMDGMMAVPVIMFKRERFMANFGQYDPFYGFAPVGTPLRTKGQ